MSKLEYFPLVTFALFSYNQENFIKKALGGALSQDYPNLEIIISDDCSSDGTFQIISEIASSFKGAHKILINRNSKNLGFVNHFNKVIKMSKGEIIVVAAGDDISMPNRVEKTVSNFLKYPSINTVSFVDKIIDSNGDLIPIRKKVNIRNIEFTLQDYITEKFSGYSGASRAYKKEIFDFFGDLNPDCSTEDTTTLIRSLLIGNGLLASDSVIFYRQHSKSLSSPANICLMNYKLIFNQYLKDVNYAFKKGKISIFNVKQVMRWAIRNYKQRLIKRAIILSKGSFLNLFKESSLVADFTFFDRAKLLVGFVIFNILLYIKRI